MSRKYRDAIILTLIGFVGAANTILAGIIPNELPYQWKPYLWWSLPLFVVLTFAGIALAIIQFKNPDKISSGISLNQEKRNRQAMLKLVQDLWVEGVLRKSIYREIRIDLRKEIHPAAVENPWVDVSQIPDQKPMPIPSDKAILRIFQECNESMLIIGEPGSGKTTTLLELTSQAIDYARNDPLQPLPVIFNLSSWKSKQTLTEWLLEELKAKYYIPPKVGHHWIEGDELFPLLDGLDEVELERRAECVRAINNFLEDHRVSIVICCRKQEYDDLSEKIKVRNAILINHLTPSQIEHYLSQIGGELYGAYNSLKRNAEFQKFVQTPLVLNIFLLAYENSSKEDIEHLMSSVDKRGHLFDVYIKRMFQRRRGNKNYTVDRTKNWLGWIAKNLLSHGQTIFYIEDISASWLLYRNEPEQTELNFFVNLMSFAIGRWTTEDLRPFPIEKIQWSLSGLVSGLVNSIGLSVVLGSIVGLLASAGGHLNGGLMSGVAAALATLIYNGFVEGLAGSEMKNRIRPGQGLFNSFKNGIVMSLLIAPVLGMVYSLGNNEIPWIVYVGFTGVIIWLKYGGMFIIFHLFLRLRLYLDGFIPLELISFLDFCTDHIFLQRVGGGYIFIHRVLMEYFAENIILNERKFKIIVRRGEIYRRGNDFRKALLYFDQAMQLDDKNIRAIINRGETYSQMGNYVEALDDFNRAIQLDDKNIRATIDRGETYEVMGDYDQALADFNRVIYLDDKNIRAIIDRGETYGWIRNYDQALVDFDHSLELLENNVWAITSRGRIHQLMGHYDQALVDFHRAIQLNKKDVSATCNLGLIYIMKGCYDQALTHLNRAIKIDDGNYWAYYFRSLVHELCGYVEQSQHDIRNAIQFARSQYEIDPNDWKNLFNLALFELFGNNLDGAEKYYQQAITSDIPLGYFPAAIYDLEDLTKVFPNNSLALHFLELLTKHLADNLQK